MGEPKCVMKESDSFENLTSELLNCTYRVAFVLVDFDKVIKTLGQFFEDQGNVLFTAVCEFKPLIHFNAVRLVRLVLAKDVLQNFRFDPG